MIAAYPPPASRLLTGAPLSTAESEPALRTNPILSLAALACAAALAISAHAASAAPKTTAAAPKTSAAAPTSAARVQLVETVPVETALGDPTLPAAHDVWLEMIGGARRTLDLEQFYLSTWPKEPMDDVVDAIGKAAGRGVQVRLLLDARMHRTYPRVADSLGRVRGIEVRLIDMGKIAGGVQHAKYFLVDGLETFLGSQNFDWRALEHIHELGVRVRDARVTSEFTRVFEMDWARSTPADSTDTRAASEHLVPRGIESLPVTIANAPGDTARLWTSYSPRSFVPDTLRWDLDAVVRTIDRAQHEVVAQVLTYAIEDRNRREDGIDLALRRAAERGVRVKLLVSDWEAGRPAMKDLMSLAALPNVEVRLSVVPEWSKGYIPFARVEHCKYMEVDSTWTWVGTSNWDPGYFHTTRNIAVTIENRPIALHARRIFDASWNAKTAMAVANGQMYPERAHGEKPPPGKTSYGE